MSTMHVPRARAGGVLLASQDVSFHHNDFDVDEALAALCDTDAELLRAYTQLLRRACATVSDGCAFDAEEADADMHQAAGAASVTAVTSDDGAASCESWQAHYMRSRHHFPLKNYIMHAFPPLTTLLRRRRGGADAAADDDAEVPTILECGCGTGSTMLPLMHQCAVATVRFVGFDVAPRALEHFRQHPLAVEHARAGMLHLFEYGASWCRDGRTATLAVDAPASNNDACAAQPTSLADALQRHGVPSRSCDAVLLVFVLSALPSVASMVRALRDVRAVMAPHGVLLLRDFALPDHNFFRYARKHPRVARETLHFVKPDGTTQMFFDKATVLWLLARGGFAPSPDPALALTLHCNRLVNRKTGVRMDKVFVNGGFVVERASAVE